MASEQITFPLRAHHLDYPFSMAVTLKKLNREDLLTSSALLPLLYDETALNPELLTSDDLIFLQLLSVLLWNIREYYSKKILSQEKYDLDLVGDNPHNQENYVDGLVKSIAQSIIAVFTPGVLIEIGDILDIVCLSCAVGDHCLELKNDDLAVALQLQHFMDGKKEPTPNGDILGQPRNDHLMIVDSTTIRSFLNNRADSILLDGLSPKDGVFLLAMIYRSILMTRKRERD